MASVHSDNEVKGIEVGIDHRPRDGVHNKAMLASDGAGPRIRLIAFMIGMGAGRICGETLAQSRLVDHGLEQGFSERRAADIP